MTPMTSVADRAHFESLYTNDPDPWAVASSDYESRKRELLLAALPRRHYRAAFEPGCGQGELTRALAARCSHVWAADFSTAALVRAKERTPQTLACRIDWLPMSIPQQLAAWFVQRTPAFLPDLIVVSELAYYLDSIQMRDFVGFCRHALEHDGDLVFCHSLRDFDDRLLDTDVIHAEVTRQPDLMPIGIWRDSDFLLQVWRRAGGAVS